MSPSEYISLRVLVSIEIRINSSIDIEILRNRISAFVSRSEYDSSQVLLQVCLSSKADCKENREVLISHLWTTVAVLID